MSVVLVNPAQAHAAFRSAWEHAKAALVAGHRLVLVVRPAKRSDEQNRKLHVMLQDIAQQQEWAGRRWDIEDWKRLLTAAWCRATQQHAHVVPALDGAGFDVLYRRTSQLTTAECSELIEFVLAWGAERGVRWSE